jgi:hypothetical protein
VNEFKGTPGPWEAVDEVVYFGRDGGISLHEAPAPVDNARLIAAAPELLAALKLMVSAYPYSPPCHGWELAVEAHSAAKQALAKALGEKP